jgi:hypothetical protein
MPFRIVPDLEESLQDGDKAITPEPCHVFREDPSWARLVDDPQHFKPQP